jgi:hypothetical protein
MWEVRRQEEEEGGEDKRDVFSWRVLLEVQGGMGPQFPAMTRRISR